MGKKMPPIRIEGLFRMLETTMYYKEDDGRFLTVATEDFLSLRNDFCSKYPDEPQYKILTILPIPWVTYDNQPITVNVVPLDDIKN